ncbi:MAG: ribokinase [bacterium]
MKNVVVVGSVNVDIFLKVPRMPRLGETILGDGFYWHIGGKGANQAVGVARLDVPVYFVGKVGNDPFQQRIIDQLKREGVNTEFVMQDEKNPSGMAVILVDKEGRNCVTVIGGANRNLSKKDVKEAREVILKADILLLQLEIPLETVEYALRLARESGVCTVLNPAPANILNPGILSNTEILVPNRDEAEKLSGVKISSLKEAKEAGTLVLGKGVKAVVLTLGEEGALLLTREKIRHFYGIPVRPLDTTGAGDSFIAALATALIQGKDLKEAVRYANHAASLSVTKLGAQASLPRKEEVEDFIAQHTMTV